MCTNLFCFDECASLFSCFDGGAAEEQDVVPFRTEFLGYGSGHSIYSCPTSALRNSTESAIDILYSKNAATSQEWNAAFEKLVRSNRLKDLSVLCYDDSDTSPDFTILIQCPLVSFKWKGNRFADWGILRVPQSIMLALRTKSDLEVLTVSEAIVSENLVILLDAACLPNLRYLSLELGSINQIIDFSKLPLLRVLKIRTRRSTVGEPLDIRPLTELRALEINLCEDDVVVELGDGLRTFDVVERG